MLKGVQVMQARCCQRTVSEERSAARLTGDADAMPPTDGVSGGGYQNEFVSGFRKCVYRELIHGIFIFFVLAVPATRFNMYGQETRQDSDQAARAAEETA